MLVSCFHSRFTHGASFTPLAQFDLNFTPLSTDTQLIDVKQNAAAVNIQLEGVSTVASLIETMQPVAQLGNGFTFSLISSSPTCVRCPTGCSACSDIFTCTTCSSGTLLGGVCISATLSASSGNAASTTFSFDVSEFQAIDSHIMDQLRTSTSQVEFSEAKLFYPNERTVSVSDPSSFYVPLHEVEGATDFIVQFYLVFKINGVTKQASLVKMSLTQEPYVTPIHQVIENAKIVSLDSNACNCRVSAECNGDTGKCTCQTGYAGTYCTLTQADLLNFQTQVTNAVTALESSLHSITAVKALTELEVLSTETDAVTDSTALKIINLVSSIVMSSSPKLELTLAATVLGNSISMAQNSEAGLSIVEAIKGVTDQMVAIAINGGTPLQINSTNLIIQVTEINPSIATSISPSPDLTLSLPAGLIAPGASSVQLSTVVFKGSLYQSVAPSGTNQASATLSLDLFADKVQQTVSNLSENIEMKFEVSSRHSVTKAKVELMVQGKEPLIDLVCGFWDPAASLVSAEGCSVVEVTATSIKCGCNHMTDFMSFLKTGLTVLEGSNYDVLLAVTQLRLQNLKRNVGIYFALGYWGTFALFCFIVQKLDKSKMKRSFFENLFMQIMNRGEKIQKLQQDAESLQKEQGKFKSERYFRELDEKSGGLYSSYKKKNSTSYLTSKTQIEAELGVSEAIMLARRKNKQFLKEVEVDISKSRGVNTSMEDLRNGRDSPVIMDNWIQEKEHNSPPSKIQKIQQRIDQTLDKEKRCCCAFGKLFKKQLSSNNQVYNLVSHTSLLNTRPVRLSLFYLAIVLEFALNALFYNLSPSEQDNARLFWDVIIENFWVALYSALFAMIPLLVIGLVLSVPSKWTRQIEQAHSVETLKAIYQGLQRKLKCKAGCGFLLFALFSNFLLLYIICFCHVANGRMSKDWARSSSITIVLDLLAFELLPAVAVAFLAVLRGYCRGCRGLVCFIVLIELYRLYRNLIEG